MFEVAKEHQELAAQAAGQNQDKEIKESMISILFCYTCLEAFINTIGKDKLGTDWIPYERDKASTEGKWMGVSNKLAEKKFGKKQSIFSNKKEPFKSFLELEIIREQLLVHRKANFYDVVRTKYGNTEGTINTLNYEKAKWACNIVKEMVNILVSVIDSKVNAELAKWVN